MIALMPLSCQIRTYAGSCNLVIYVLCDVTIVNVCMCVYMCVCARAHVCTHVYICVCEPSAHVYNRDVLNHTGKWLSLKYYYTSH